MTKTLRSLLVLFLCVWGASAHAGEDPAVAKARVHLRAGIADYDEGRYAEAASQMEQAYALKPVADLQYNLAQCYERLHRLDDAVRAYETYLAGRGDAPDAETVKKRIANLRERAIAEAEGRKDISPPKAVEEKVVFKTLVVYRAVPAPPGRAARWAAYGLGVLGVAGLATGIAFAVLTTQASNEVHDGGNVSAPPRFDPTTQNAAHLYPIGTGVGFAVGGLAIGGAVGLYIASRKIDREATRQRELDQSRVPTVAPFYARSGAGETAGLVVAGHF